MEELCLAASTSGQFTTRGKLPIQRRMCARAARGEAIVSARDARVELHQEVLLCRAERVLDQGSLHGDALAGGQEPRKLLHTTGENAVDTGDRAQATVLVRASLVDAEQ